MRLILIAIAIIASSCARRIGDLTMVSTRNIDSKVEYVELKRYAKGKGPTIEMAVDKAIKEVPGGEFMKNVVIYSNGKVGGDVWGVKGVLTEKQQELAQEKHIQKEISDQFSIGDKVSWKNAAQLGKIYTGVISGKDDKYAIIKLDSNQKLVKIKYEILTIIKL